MKLSLIFSRLNPAVDVHSVRLFTFDEKQGFVPAVEDGNDPAIKCIVPILDEYTGKLLDTDVRVVSPLNIYRILRSIGGLAVVRSVSDLHSMGIEVVVDYVEDDDKY